ncbi:hypothetical protein ACO2Q3_15865 [Caulobacter sp. KR2-114]|uniref:hypothetical protein n=1 Tax=Caulobacter sp. KR2-114 TaxID=3400912 RepID=UPI003C0B0E5B
MRRLTMLPAMLILALGACSLPAADKESDAEARKLYDEIRTGADLREDPNLADFLRAPDKLADLAAIKGELPAGEPTKVENRSWNYNTTNDGSVATLVHAYVYPDNTVMAETVLRKTKGEKSWTIAGFHVSLAHPNTPGQKI